MGSGLADGQARAGKPRAPRRGWLVLIAVGCLVAIHLGAAISTHTALSASPLRWADSLPGESTGLRLVTTAQAEQIVPDQAYTEILWARHPGGEVAVGFEVHNGGPVPITLLGLALPVHHPDVVHVFAPAGAQLGNAYSQMRPFHSVALGPGATVAVGLTERVICDPTVRLDARLRGDPARTSVVGSATSPVVLRYRVLGLMMSQTTTVDSPLLVAMPYRACK